MSQSDVVPLARKPQGPLRLPSSESSGGWIMIGFCKRNAVAYVCASTVRCSSKVLCVGESGRRNRRD